MYLKKLEILGFKSFADRTKIDFDHGITAVVGPNGSGKSNITEALRWALGEQSVKSLRGGRMPDIIFAGTEKRKPQNFAEVTAYFDNQDHYLDSDEEQVTVTRRLYRNGDSNFLINGKKRRLKDVHDLFMDTGLGRDSFSIISQGRIESIFSSKPEDRRMIIEEAAGVLKYKNRRQETESKLAYTQENLDRLEDIIYELSGQLKPLEKQKEVALKFQELEKNRKHLSLSVLLSQIHYEKIRYEQLKKDLTEVNQELSSLSEERKSFDLSIFKLKNRQSEIDKIRENQQTNLLNLNHLKSDFEKKIEIFDLQKINQEKTDKEKEKRLQDLFLSKKNIEGQLAESLKKFSELEKNKKEFKELVSKLSEELATFSESPEKQTEKIQELYLQEVNREAQLMNQLTKNEIEVNNFLQQQEDIKSSNKERFEKLQNQSEELSLLTESYQKQKAEINQSLELFREHSQSLKIIQESRAKAEEEQFKYLEKLNKKQAQLNSLENIHDNHSNLYAGVRAVMKSNLSGIIGVVADQLSFDKKYETALEIALSAAAQNIITENEQSAQAAIRYLRENQLGRASFLPLTTIKVRELREVNRLSQFKGFIGLASQLVSYSPKIQAVISNLLATTVIVETVEDATAMAKGMNFTVRIVTLDGTLLSPGGSYTGGSRVSRNNVTFIRNEIENLTLEVQTLNDELKIKELSVKNFQEKEKEESKFLTQLREKGEKERFDERELELKIKQVTQTKEDLESLLALEGAKNQSFSLEEIYKENQEITQKLIDIKDKKLELEKELDLVKISSNERHLLQQEKSEALTLAKVEESTVQSKLGFIKSECQRFEEELKKQEKEIDSLSYESEERSSEEKLSFENQLLQVSQQIEEANMQQVSLKFEYDDLKAQIDDLTERNSEINQKNQSSHDKKTRLDIQTEQSEQQLRRRHQQLTEGYQLSFEEAKTVSEVILEEEFLKSKKDLGQLEQKIRQLGPINIEAIQQFEEVNERYTFLNGQKDDLLEAKALLVSSIQEMNDEVKVRFKSTYDAIRESFKLTFHQMFTGGEADLILTTDDLLTAGIDILAQPPGKKLGSLTLMSGGEKALTALALLFAILRVRTVPFVVLDEVEAALDEANVKRFGDYMNHFDNSNQFIVVTHRKGTMAAAQVMYGVTMSEAGVSKLVSVRFENKEIISK
ncbi:MAG: chromosome segregation protein SMC [Lactovum sp.]